jgi:hypothetical protein
MAPRLRLVDERRGKLEEKCGKRASRRLGKLSAFGEGSGVATSRAGPLRQPGKVLAEPHAAVNAGGHEGAKPPFAIGKLPGRKEARPGDRALAGSSRHTRAAKADIAFGQGKFRVLHIQDILHICLVYKPDSEEYKEGGA